jgi:hypothetical protein
VGVIVGVRVAVGVAVGVEVRVGVGVGVRVGVGVGVRVGVGVGVRVGVGVADGVHGPTSRVAELELFAKAGSGVALERPTVWPSVVQGGVAAAIRRVTASVAEAPGAIVPKLNVSSLVARFTVPVP